VKYFVTGTDTGVGKTFVTVAMARHARARGLSVFAFKPIETGVTTELGDDQRELCAAAGGWQTDELAGVYRLKQPVAPAVAATAEGTDISIERIIAVAQRGMATAKLTLVEGAGGWRVPITGTLEMADLARRLGLAVIVVARTGLGTINHSLLTLDAVERSGCRVASLILSKRPEDEEALAQSNVAEIQKRWSGRTLVLGQDSTVLDPHFT
jgi:dethiobiotin synthetase